MAQQPMPPAYENLPTSGAMGTQPALSVGALTAFATMTATALAVSGVYVPSPEVQGFFDQYGSVIAVLIVGAIPFVQGWLTRAHVYAPASCMASPIPQPRRAANRSSRSPPCPVAKSFQTPRLAPLSRTDSEPPASPLTEPAFHSWPCRRPFGNSIAATSAACSARRSASSRAFTTTSVRHARTA